MRSFGLYPPRRVASAFFTPRRRVGKLSSVLERRCFARGVVLFVLPVFFSLFFFMWSFPLYDCLGAQSAGKVSPRLEGSYGASVMSKSVR